MPPGASITEILARLDALEDKSRRDDERIAELEAEVAGLRAENAELRGRLTLD